MFYYYLYQITNLVNGKIYVGVHKTSDLNDGYMGSGKVIKSAISKYGIENFTKDILEFFENAELMYAREKEVVNDEFLLREDTYNLRRGGTGGFDYINNGGLNLNLIQEARSKGWENWKLGAMQSKAAKMKRVISRHSNGGFTTKGTTGLKFSKESKLKMSASALGSNNSQFGKCWISHELIGTRKCLKELLPEMIDQGWLKGRNKFDGLLT